MASRQKNFEVIEFKTQQEINADRRKKIEKERQALQRKIKAIRNQGEYNHKRKSFV